MKVSCSRRMEQRRQNFFSFDPRTFQEHSLANQPFLDVRICFQFKKNDKLLQLTMQETIHCYQHIYSE